MTALFEVVYGRFNRRMLLSSEFEILRFLSFPFDSVQLSLSRQGIKIKNFVKSVGRTVKPALQARSSGYFFCASRINRYAFPQYLVVENELVLVFNNTNRNAKLHGNARLSFLNPASMFFK